MGEGASVGRNIGGTDGINVGTTVEILVGALDGGKVDTGAIVRLSVGVKDDGFKLETKFVGTHVGAVVLKLGLAVGDILGAEVGDLDGLVMFNIAADRKL